MTKNLNLDFSSQEGRYLSWAVEHLKLVSSPHIQLGDEPISLYDNTSNVSNSSLHL